MSNALKDLRDYLFRVVTFEAEAEQFRKAGIRVCADQLQTESELLKEVLSPFNVQLRNEALQMSRLGALLYCFENSVRDLIRERLTEKHGSDWWHKRVPQAIQRFGESRQQAAEKDSWLEGSKKDLLGFVEFGHLADIIANSWEDFADLVPSQHWLKQRMEELEKSRNFIAHNRFLLPSEFQRIEMYVSDWNRMVGF